MGRRWGESHQRIKEDIVALITFLTAQEGVAGSYSCLALNGVGVALAALSKKGKLPNTCSRHGHLPSASRLVGQPKCERNRHRRSKIDQHNVSTLCEYDGWQIHKTQ